MKSEIRSRLISKKSQKPGCRRYTPSEKKEILSLYDSGVSVSALHEQFGVSDNSVYMWLKKRKEIKKAGEPEIKAFVSKSRRPHRIHYKVSEEDRKLILSIKKNYPFMGPVQIKHQLARFYDKHINHKTIGKILEQEGFPLQRGSKKEKLKAPKRFEASKPLELVQMDFKEIHIFDSRYYLFCILDDHSRYLLYWNLSEVATGKIAMQGIDEVLKQHGKPENILADQGVQWCNYSGKTEFEKHVESLGINMIHARSHHPQTCGKVESIFRALNREVIDRVEFIDIEDARNQISSWIRFYNEKRCHSGIGGVPPADRFEARLKKPSINKERKKLVITLEEEVEILFKKAG